MAFAETPAAVAAGVSANAIRAVTKHSTLFLERTLWKRGENGGCPSPGAQRHEDGGQERHTSTMVLAALAGPGSVRFLFDWGCVTQWSGAGAAASAGQLPGLRTTPCLTIT